MNYADKNIIFYDGDCGFCNRTIQFVLKYERNNNLFFAAIQSPFANKFFKENNFTDPDLSTFYFYTNYTLLDKSNAALALMRFMKFPFPLLRIFTIIPVCFRNQMYDFIAKRRHKIASPNCFLPDADQRKRFLIQDDNI